MSQKHLESQKEIYKLETNLFLLFYSDTGNKIMEVTKAVNVQVNPTWLLIIKFQFYRPSLCSVTKMQNSVCP